MNLAHDIKHPTSIFHIHLPVCVFFLLMNDSNQNVLVSSPKISSKEILIPKILNRSGIRGAGL